MHMLTCFHTDPFTMATYDGSDEPLFADDLDDFPDDEEPPPLPPPVFPRPRSSSAQDQEGDTSHRVGGGFQVSTHGHSGKKKM